MYRIFFFLFVVIIIYFAGCNDEDVTPSPIAETTATRTVLVYMGGNNNLSNETYQKLKALQEGWNQDIKGNLIVYHAPSDSNPKLIEICHENGECIIKTIQNYSKTNTASADIFKDVYKQVISQYPAQSYGLVIFSHASGWLPEATLLNPRSVFVDGTDEMDLCDLAAALPDNSLDFIVFEACFMAGIEVAYELKDKTNYILASSAEILSPGFTEIYSNYIHYLFDNQSNLDTFAEKIYNYFDAKQGDYSSVTLSIIRTKPLETLLQWLKLHKIDAEINISEVQHFDRYTSYRLFFDFEDYFSRLVSSEEEKKVLKDLIEDCIVYKSATPSFMINYNGFYINNHSGLTTYIQQERFPYLNEEYKKLKWNIDLNRKH